jgi:8-oxo-dGTP diphosphatase
MTERKRVAAVIQRADKILMVRERVQTSPGHHDGPEYWTLPGGGIEPGEDPLTAVHREVLEEVGLTVTTAQEVAQVPSPSGLTTIYRVQVAPGDPHLGTDPLPCPCPRMVALDWVPTPPLQPTHGGSPVPLLIYCW